MSASTRISGQNSTPSIAPEGPNSFGKLNYDALVMSAIVDSIHAPEKEKTTVVPATVSSTVSTAATSATVLPGTNNNTTVVPGGTGNGGSTVLPDNGNTYVPFDNSTNGGNGGGYDTGLGTNTETVFTSNGLLGGNMQGVWYDRETTTGYEYQTSAQTIAEDQNNVAMNQNSLAAGG